jgi:hypothetical protein
MAPAERRALLDAARAEVGLRPTGAVDTRWEIRRVNVQHSLQACHAPECSDVPLTQTGSWRAVNVRRWFCPQHEHLAEPGDMDDLGSGVKLSESGVLVPSGPDDSGQAAEESRRRRQQDRQADRAADLAEHEAHEAGKRAQLRAESPEHIRRLLDA